MKLAKKSIELTKKFRSETVMIQQRSILERRYPLIA
jgi:hypothetical protein